MYTYTVTGIFIRDLFVYNNKQFSDQHFHIQETIYSKGSINGPLISEWPPSTVILKLARNITVCRGAILIGLKGCIIIQVNVLLYSTVDEGFKGDFAFKN